MLENFIDNLETFNEIDYLRTLISFFCCVILSFALKYLYIEKATSLSNTFQIANTLPVLSLIVFFVILIVKSSLALSLGLVGALSIVRFRTPIKEPEELIYLFLAIAIGLGFGAGQIVPSGIICVSIFIIIWFFVGNKDNKSSSEYNLVIRCDQYDKNNNAINNEYISENLKIYFKNFNLIKYESNDKNTTFIIKLFVDDIKQIDAFKNKLLKELNNLEINYYYSNTVY
jgi:hypothetical protein|tara:strand:- start:356 stop:1042 length:687 start_codon:yes stop_codon:yes gene_type:complete